MMLKIYLIYNLKTLYLYILIKYNKIYYKNNENITENLFCNIINPKYFY